MAGKMGLQKAVPTQTKVTVGNTTTQILAANDDREYAVIVNDSDEEIFLRLGENAVMNEGVRINAYGGSYELFQSNEFRGVINGICSSGSKNVTVMESY